MSIDNISELFFLAAMIAVLFRLTLTVEDVFFYARTLVVAPSVMNVPNDIRVKVLDIDGQECILQFRSVSDYQKWAHEHIKCAKQVADSLSEPMEDE